MPSNYQAINCESEYPIILVALTYLAAQRPARRDSYSTSVLEALKHNWTTILILSS